MATSSHDPHADGAAGGGGAEQALDEAQRLARHDIARLRAENPGPLTLSGTNTWLFGREPAWLIDPGPALPDHLDAIFAELAARGGLGGLVLTHDHSDHNEAVEAVLARYPAPLAAARGTVDVELIDGERVGPFEAIATPGHAPDHFALLAGGACFTGDAVLGEGSVFIAPHPGAMSGYLRALTELSRRGELQVLCPGHGPAVWDAHAKLEEYVAHRLDRENRLIAALGEGLRSTPELLRAAWPEVPEFLYPAATATLAAHLDKLEEDGVLPAGVERPEYERTQW